MRVAALYDIHGNFPALEAVLADVRDAGVDQIVVGGDVVPGPMPSEVLDCLFDLAPAVRFIRGNGEREVLARIAGIETGAVPERYRESMRWVAKRIEPDIAKTIARWPKTLRVDVDGIGSVLFCHATPRNDTEISTKDTGAAKLEPIFAAAGAPTVVCGHTHMQFDRVIGGTRVVNAGSVGTPFGAPGAYWLLLGDTIELRRTEYDVAVAAERVRAGGYPMAEEFAALNILNPPSEATMLEAFRKSEIG